MGRTKSFNNPYKKKKRSLTQKYGISLGTLRALALLVTACIVAVAINWFDNTEHTATHDFLASICASENTQCHHALVPSRRTQRAVLVVNRGETVLVVPRHLQLWDLDALRDPFVQQHLASAKSNGKPPQAGAYLAAYMALLLSDEQRLASLHPILQEYLTSVLPTYSTFLEIHPVLWPKAIVGDLLGEYSSSFHRVLHYQQRFRDEYDSFATTSKEFLQKVNLEMYVTARLNVMTRSFGTGPLESSFVEVRELENLYGIDLSKGYHAMVPILDQYDHHPHPNVGFAFESARNAFVVKCTSKIVPGQEVMDSYGKRTDSDLFARYGFVNGDGSGWTEASVALWHSYTLNTDKRNLVRYLQYDDGYAECVQESNGAAWRLKTLKLKALRAIEKIEKHWVARMSPMDSVSLPSRSTDTPITLNIPPEPKLSDLQFDGESVFATCRLISLTENDYNGNATHVLQEALGHLEAKEKSRLDLPVTKDSLEYRTLLCVARMVTTSLKRFPLSLEQQELLVAQRNKDSFGMSNWTVAHVHLGEMRTLSMMKQVALGSLRRTFGDDALEDRNRQLYLLRDKPCPPHLQRAVLA